MIYNTRAIVLSNLRYGDNSLIVDLYTEKIGRQTIFIKGAFSKKSKMSAALFQPLNLLEIDLHHRQNRQMQRISNVQMHSIFQNIQYNPVKSCIAMFIAEALYKTLKEEEANHELFSFLLHAIQTLDLNNEGTANFHIAFLIEYSKYLGFYLKYENILAQNFEVSFENLNGLALNKMQRNEITEYLLSRYSIYVENFGTMKSFSVLQNVFGDGKY